MKAVVAVVAWTLGMAGAMAHHGPEDVIAELTAQLARSGDDVVVLSRRATEYRALGKQAEAEADLRRVLVLNPDSARDAEALGRVMWAQGKREEALGWVGRAVDAAQAGRERAGSMILRAEWEMALGRDREAYATCTAAFREDPVGLVDWYLLRSRLQERLDLPVERVAGLRAGHAALGSVVLRNAWVDALLDARRCKQALPVIESALATARLKSSWLIRRGRARLGMGAVAAGRADLAAAITELNRRIHPERPDAELLLDRGWAHEMLGRKDAAGQDLRLARKHHGDPWGLERLAAAVGE